MNLKKLRQKIDQIDRQLVDLFNQRTQIALEIGHQKLKNQQGIYAPERELRVYKNVLEQNRGPLPPTSLKAIFREVMSAALSVEKAIRVAYLGPVATFTHQASIQKFGSSVEYLPMEGIADVFLEVEKGRADYGVVPIENSTEGAVTHTLDVLMDSDLKICSEVLLKIRHSLLSNTSIEKIIKIYSNPQVFGQCRSWLREHLSKVDQIEVSSTSRAAEMASKEKGAAALASSLATQYYPIRMLAEGIEDFQKNVTRFLVVGSHAAQRTGRDKTSILFSVRDKVGALYEMLVPFKKHRINLTKIESRPSKKKVWEYCFYIDLVGHQDDAHVKAALKSLEKHCHFLKILGSYPEDSR
ncbi:MAG: prephenate dehydratase [Chlamydiae bacterium]|nr:prephenate dehydratase [Chlamydiota bacterium]MBI3277758.1 prephenate dehydratase [Chlamydiota bacterium]